MSQPGARRATSTSPTHAGSGGARSGGRVAAVVVVLLVLVTAGALALAGRADPVASAGADTANRLTSPAERQLVCPGSSSASTSYVGRLPGNEGGRISVGKQDLDLAAGARTSITDPDRDPITVLTRGTATRGIFADRAQDKGGMTSCGSPRASWWFTGAGANPAHRSRLVIFNPRPGPAVVDVSVYGNQGAVSGAGLRGVSVKSGERRVLELADVSPTDGNLAVHVQVSRGLVVAAVEDQTLDVLDPKAEPAAEYLPDQHAPATHLVLNGLPPPSAVDTALQVPNLPQALRDGAGLVLANPGGTAAVVQVRFSDVNGTRLPRGLDKQTVPPRSVITVPLAKRLRKPGTAIVVDADQPITGGYVVPGVTDLVHAAPGLRWRGPAAASLPIDAKQTLVLTADDGSPADGSGSNAAREKPAKVTVVQLGERGARLKSEQMSIPARSTVPVKLTPGVASVEVTAAGDVAGSVLVERGSTFSAVPLAPVLSALRVPVVRPGAE